MLRYEVPVLVRGWEIDPVQGAGFGATLADLHRDPQKPWNFEAQYALLLFQTGILGVALLLAAAVLSWRALKDVAVATGDGGIALILVATTATVLCILIANAVDPYLQAPGVCWGMYLPFAAANIAFRGMKPLRSTGVDLRHRSSGSALADARDGHAIEG